MAIRISLNEQMDLDNRAWFVEPICNLLFFPKLFPPPHHAAAVGVVPEPLRSAAEESADDEEVDLLVCIDTGNCSSS